MGDALRNTKRKSRYPQSVKSTDGTYTHLPCARRSPPPNARTEFLDIFRTPAFYAYIGATFGRTGRIDNNVSERTLRHQAVGRRNWLFLGNEAAGPRAAVLYTILAGAKRHRIEPWAYVRDLLLRPQGTGCGNRRRPRFAGP